MNQVMTIAGYLCLAATVWFTVAILRFDDKNTRFGSPYDDPNSPSPTVGWMLVAVLLAVGMALLNAAGVTK